jgi:hypothetical protein
VTPNTGNRLESNTLILKGSNFVPGLTKVVFIPAENITINSSSVDSVDQITANITIGAAAGLGQRLIVVYNTVGDTSGNVAFTVNLAGPPIPVLRSPSNGSQYQPTTVALRWSPSAGATGYHVQLSTSQTFATVKIDTSVTDTSAIVGPLTLNTTYYWHVNSSNAGPTASSYSSAWSFLASYPARIAISDTVLFPTKGSASDYVSTDYRLVGLPGGGPIPVANYFAGTVGTDWNVVWDNGAASSYWVQYAAGSPFTFGSGSGFWVVRKGNWSVKDNVASAALDANGQVAIPLHLGFNIITNPFTAIVNWSDVITLNPPTGGIHPLWAFPGAFVQATTLVPYTGYYFENTDSLASLKIPFKSGPAAAKSASSVASDSWIVRIDLNAGGTVEQVSGVGTSPGAVKGRNSMDYHRPRAMKGIPTVVLNRPAWDPVNSEFATDIRPPVQSVESWDFEVRTTLRTPVQLAFRDVGSVPGQFQVLLLDEGRARSLDLRANTAYTFTPVTDVSAFTLVVGTPEGVKTRIDELLPKVFALGNSFPNPFNPETTIPVAVPYASQIRLVVYNILGAEVRTLYDGSIEGGKYWFRWDGRNERGNTVASGVYFVRLTTAKGLAFIQKMALVK